MSKRDHVVVAFYDFKTNPEEEKIIGAINTGDVVSFEAINHQAPAFTVPSCTALTKCA